MSECNTDLFYLQDRRSYVGNCILFWAEKGGYTTDVDKARKFTQKDAFKQHRERPDIDIPIPCAYIDARTSITVDCQNVRVKEALEQKGLSLYEPPKPKHVPLKCHGCGQFLSERDYWHTCPNCGSYNRP
jgi:hypothetical protein